MRTLGTCLGLMLCVLKPSAALAQSALHWVRAKGAERCIEPAALAERVEGLTGGAVVPPAAAEVSIEGLVEREGSGSRVTLTSVRRGRPRSAERVLRSRTGDCRELDAAVAFIIAVTLDPARALQGIPPELLAAFNQDEAPELALLAELERAAAAPVPSAPELPPPAPAIPGLVVEAAPAPVLPAVRERPALRIALSAATLGGSSPSWLGGVQGSFAVVWSGRIALGFALNAFPSAHHEPLAPQRSAVFQSYDGAVSVCPGFRRGRWQAGGCAGVSLAYLYARGHGFERDRSAGLWDPAANLELVTTVRLWRGLGLRGSAALRVRFLSPLLKFAVGDEEQPAYWAPRVGGVFSLGPSYAF